MNFRTFKISPNESLKNTEWAWILGDSDINYLNEKVIEVTETEANNYYKAVQELYEMFTHAAQHVIDNELFTQLSIPENLIEIIKYTWENDKNWQIYGRFDLSGGLDNKPIKLIEFNADTATSIPETALVQWAHLTANGELESSQFNTVFESLTEQFENLKKDNPEYNASLLISTMEGYPEDETNMQILAEAAKEAGFEVDFEFIEKVDFSAEEGIYKQNENDGSFTKFDFWFKLVPWEYIAWDEPELAATLTEIILTKKAVILNPPYTLLFQSKGILKILWDLYPNHPLLLEASFEPLKYQKCVEKVMFGREGANIAIISEYGTRLTTTVGDYEKQKVIYQKYTEFLKDNDGNCYQAGVFFASEGCGLGFRKGGEIIDNLAQFCGHIIV
jgi:glutathionylspermidine synthase